MAETFLGNYFGPQGDAVAKFIEDNALGTYRGKSKGEAARQYGDVGQVGDAITLEQSLQDDEIRNKLLDSALEARRMGEISGSGKVTEGLEIDPDIQDIGTAAKNYSDIAGFAALERVLGKDEASKQMQNIMGDLPRFGGGQFTSRQFPGTEIGTPDDSRAPFEMEAPSTSPGMFDGIDFGTTEALDNQSMVAKLLDERRRQQGQIPREAIDLLQQENSQDLAQSMAMGESGDVDEGGSVEDAGQFNPSEAFMDATKEIYKSQGEELQAPDGRLSEAERIEYYKQKFADATGLDISGKPDNRDALMAFGLALMQNKAGKGFNVGKMLSSIGQAGQAALPELTAARKEAQRRAIAAGEYALKMSSLDEKERKAALEKANKRDYYYVMPKASNTANLLANISEGKGKLEFLSAAEINALMKNPKFREMYDVLPNEMYGKMIEKAMEKPEAKNLYRTSPVNVSLIPGIEDELFTIRVYDADPNTNPGGKSIVADNGQQQYEALARMSRDNNAARNEFVKLGILNEGANAFRYSVDALNSMASAFGVQFSDKATETDKMKMILRKLQAKNAPAILGEAGKTISDADRQMVKDIVGDITIMSDPRLLAEKFESLFNDIIMKADRDILQALSTLDRYTGRNVSAALQKAELTEEEAKELREELVKLGAI